MYGRLVVLVKSQLVDDERYDLGTKCGEGCEGRD